MARKTALALALIAVAVSIVCLFTIGCGSSDPQGSGPPEGDFTGLRTIVGLGTSMECYTFSSDGIVELRHGGSFSVSDQGRYSGNGDVGEVVWNSGRVSKVEREGDDLEIDGALMSSINTCT